MQAVGATSASAPPATAAALYVTHVTSAVLSFTKTLFKKLPAGTIPNATHEEIEAFSRRLLGPGEVVPPGTVPWIAEANGKVVPCFLHPGSKIQPSLQMVFHMQQEHDRSRWEEADARREATLPIPTTTE